MRIILAVSLLVESVWSQSTAHGACKTDADCPDNAPVCFPSGFCQPGSCRTDADCSARAPHCSQWWYCQPDPRPSHPSGKTCPSVPARPPHECAGQVSTCWSPGVPDTDCPNNGLCCNDGCANTCLGAPPPPPSTRCSTVNTTIWDVEWEETKEKVCKDVCETYTEKECKEVAVTTTEYYHETVCTMEDQKHCVKVWKKAENGEKVWVDNPDDCRKYTEDVCKEVKKSKPVVKYETKCINKTKTRTRKDCEDIHKRIPKEVSKKVPKTVCTY